MKTPSPKHLLTASALALTIGLGVAGAQQSNSDVSPQVSQQAQEAANNNKPLDTTVSPQQSSQMMPGGFADLVEKVAPAVVNITTTSVVTQPAGGPTFPEGSPFSELFRDFGFQGQPGEPGQPGQHGQPRRQMPQRSNSLGSGFVISADGFIVTNNHVIDGADEIEIELYSGKTLPAKVVGTDPNTDLALLKVNSDSALPFVKFGDSDKARVGDWVMALGNPLGQGFSASTGIVSARNRELSGTYDDFLQTDAAINRGNSGGPLFDMQGNVIGINNAILSPSGGSVGVGFAIPADTAAPIVERLRRGEAIERGYLGVSIGPVTDDFAAALGLPRNRGEVVQSVVDGEAAQKAGIEPGDVVISVNGKDVTPDQTLSFLVANVKPGTTIPVTLIRDGKQRTIKLKVGTRPSAEELAQSQMFGDEGEEDEMNAPLDQEEFLAEKLGLGVVPINPGIARQLGISAETTGLAVAAVDRNSDAARKGIQRRDIILSANYRPVTSAEQLEGIVRDAERDGRNAVVLRVQRARGPAGYVAVRIQD